MALYTVDGPDGKTYSIEGPEGASQEEVRAAVRRRVEAQQKSSRRDAERERLQAELEAAQRAATDAKYAGQAEEDAGFFENIATGFGAGAVDVGEMAALGGAALLDEENELAVRSKIQAAAEAIRPEGGDKDAITYNLAKALGSIAGVAVPAYLGAVAAPAVATTAVGTGIAGLLSVGAGAGEASERARAAGATEEERSAAALRGAPIGALEILPLGRALKFVDIPVFTKFIDRLGPDPVEGFTDYLKNAGLTGALEAGQEGTSAILQNLNERGYNKEAEILGGVLEEAGYGGGAGAILQLLADGKRGIQRARAKKAAEGGGEPTPEEIQGELFGDQPLGAAPVTEQPTPDQAELFPDTDLGRAPEQRGDPDQLDLFGVPTTPQPEATQDELFPRVDQAAEERAQRAARDREAERAAERGDEEAFDQPDLFALQQEQERRRLGPEELRQPEQFMDTVEEPEATPTPEPRQLDIEEAIADETQLAEMQAQEDAEAAQAAEIRTASELETIAGQQDTQRQQATEQRRTAVLQDVIEKTPTRQEGTLANNFARALEAEGIANTQPTEAELNTIRRAIDVQRAEPVTPEVEPAPAPKQFQVRDGERLPQTEVPFVPERRTAAEARDVEIKPITKEVMDDIGIPPAAPIRKRIEGKDVADPTVRDDLATFAANPKVKPQVKEKINEQLELFPLDDGGRGPERGRGPVAPVTAPEQAPDRISPAIDRPVLGRPSTASRDTGRTTAPEPAGVVGTERAAAPVDVREGVQPTALTADPRTLLAQLVGESQVRTRKKPAAKAAPKPAAKAAPKAAPKKPVVKKAPAAKKAPSVTKKSIAEEVKAIRAIGRKRRAATQLETAMDKTVRAEASDISFYTAPFSETGATTATFINESGDTETVTLDVRTSDSDDKKILDLIKTELPAQRAKETSSAKEARAAQIYFSKQENPADALDVIAHEVVFADKEFRSAPDMSAGERAYFAQTGSKRAADARAWVANNLDAATNERVDDLVRMHQASLNDAIRKENTALDFVAEQRKVEALRKRTEAEQARVDKRDNRERRKAAEAEFLSFTEEDLDFLPDYLKTNAVVGLDIPTHPVIGNLLREGKLVEALRALQATSPSSRVAQVAGALAKVVGNTKVEVKPFLSDEAGNPVAGMFDPRTNTITLDAETGINPHTILHEMTHAATSATLANKSHPITKQLTKLFNEVKDSLGTMYGAQNVDEFVSEAFSNPVFQQELAQINPKGEPVTALQRFLNTVTNFLRKMMGMQTKPLGSAVQEVDTLIDAMLAPAPESRGAGSLYMMSMLGGARAAKAAVDSLVRNRPTWDAAGAKRIKRIIEDRFPDGAKSFVLGLLPINALADVARARIPMVDKLEKLMFEASGKVTEMNSMIEPVVNRVSTWGSKNSDKLDAFNNLIYTSTLEQVDPSKDLKEYSSYRISYTDPKSTKLEKKVEYFSTKEARDARAEALERTLLSPTNQIIPITKINPQKEKVAQWRAMQSDWNSIGKEGQDHYKSMRNTYKHLYDEMGRVLKAKIDEGISDEGTRKKVFTEVYNALYDNGVIEPYFPLTRSGSYWLSYNAIDPRTGNREFYVEAFETKADRTETERVMRADPDADAKNFEPFSNLSEVTYDKAPPTSFVNNVLKTMEANKVDAKVKEQIMRLFLDSLPERSFAQSFRNRKGTLGFERDAIGALRKRTSSLSRQLVQMEYGQKIQAVQDEIKNHVTNVEKNNDTAVLLANEIDQRANWAKNPNVETWAQALTTGGFVMTLGANISSVVVNFSQLPMVVMPYLGGKYGYSETMKATGRAIRMFKNSGLKRTTETIGPDGKITETTSATPSLDNYNFDDPNTPAEVKEFKVLAEVAARMGQLNRSITYDMLDMDKIDSPLRKLGAVSGWLFHHGERMNRQVALMTAYDLELGAMRKAGRTINDAARTEAAEKAIYVTELTNGGAIATGAPRYARKSFGKVMFLFKRFGISMTYHLAKLAKESIKGSDADKLVARKQLAGTVGMAGLIGGAQGIPMMGVLGAVLDLFGDEDEDNFDTTMRKTLGEGFYGGLGNYLFGVDVASRMGLSDLIFRDRLVQKDQSLFFDAIEAVGGPVVGTALNMERGLKMVNDGNVERGIEAMAPAAIRNVMKGIRFATEGANTLRGDPIVGDVHAGHVFGQIMGFAPAEYTKQLQENASLKRKDRAAGTEKSKLYKRYYIAAREGDTSEMKAVLKDMQKYNKKFPQTAITNKSFRQSMKAHQRTTSRMHHGIVLNQKMRGEHMRDAAEYDDTITLWQDIGLTD